MAARLKGDSTGEVSAARRRREVRVSREEQGERGRKELMPMPPGFTIFTIWY
jgi:hypothetical protein